MKAPTKTVLVLRLSSMGDLLLSTAFLENLPPGVGVDWVIHEKFAFVLEGHPRIRKLYLYDKNSGLKGWVELMRKLAKAHYDARVDLHATLRSAIAGFIFAMNGRSMLRVPKQRFRTFLYFCLKRFDPRPLRPSPYWQRFSEMGLKTTRVLGIPAVEPSDPSYRLHPPRYPLEVEVSEAASILAEYQLRPKRYVAVMPASRWASKEWGIDRYFKAIATLAKTQSDPFLILGRESDAACAGLLQRLHDAGITARSALNEEEFRVTAYLLQQAKSYLGGDTGLAHLAEAVGTPAVILFGPTQPDVGFGPWRRESRAISTPVLCSPCSKDGRPCYRIGQPYECFARIQPEQVVQAVSRMDQGGRS